MQKITKKLVPFFVLLLSLSFTFNATVAFALTSDQINAILGLVRSFGVDDSVIKNVDDSLNGRTPAGASSGGGGGSAGFCYNWTRNLRIGDNSVEVKALHQALYKENILGGEASDRTEFMEVTASAISEFQEKYASEILTPNGLRRGNGYVGASTRTKLNSLYGCSMAVPSPVAFPPPPPLPPLQTVSIGTTTINSSMQKPLIAGCASYGDFNLDGFISQADIDLLRAHVIGTKPLDTKRALDADLNIDGQISTPDISYLTRYLVGTVSTFPVCSVGQTKPSITVLSPNEGETYQVGSVMSIRWSIAGTIPTGTNVGLQISYTTSNGTVFEEVIRAEKFLALPTGGYVWAIPEKYGTGMNPSRFKMRAILYGPGIPGTNPPQDYSDSYFTITASTTATSKPLVCGTLGDMNNDGVISSADSDKIRAFVLSLTTLTEDEQKRADTNGSGSISTADIPSITSYLAGTQTTFPGCTQAIQPKITVTEPTNTTTQPSITVLSPNGGETLTRGAVKTIQWTRSGSFPIGSVQNIRLLKSSADGSSQTVYPLYSFPANSTDTSYSWTVDKAAGEILQDGSNYKIQVVVSASATVAMDESNTNFTITTPVVLAQPSITVTSPNGGENYRIGDTILVRFTVGTPGVRQIFLENLIGGEAANLNIMSVGSPNMTGEFLYNVPANFPMGQYKVVLYYDSIRTEADRSNSYFTITASTPPLPVSTATSKPLVCGSIGDVNADGVISSADSDLARTFVLSLAVPTDTQRTAADVNKSGAITTLDVGLINAYIAGTVSTFSACTIATSIESSQAASALESIWAALGF